MKKILLILVFSVSSLVILSQSIKSIIDEKLQLRTDTFFVFDPKFTFINIELATVYEVDYYSIDTIGGRVYCEERNFFSLKKPSIKNIQKYLADKSYVNFGIYYDYMRPSKYAKEAIQNYDVTNLIDFSSSEYGYKINGNEYFKLKKTTVIVQKYLCESGDYYQYYFPLKDRKKSSFVYYEIIKVLTRSEIIFGDRVSVKCNPIPHGVHIPR